MEWNIQSRASACQSCKKHFADKEEFHTLLFDAKGGYERLDICQDCWNQQFSQGATDRKGFISYWQSQYQVPPAAPPEPIQKETAETLLRKLVEQNDPAHTAARFILAAMLERKRIFKVKAQLSRDGQRIFVYEHPRTGDLFQIVDPNLQLHQLEEVQKDVMHLLQHGLDAPSAPTADQAAPGPEQPPADPALPGATAEAPAQEKTAEESPATA